MLTRLRHLKWLIGKLTWRWLGETERKPDMEIESYSTKVNAAEFTIFLDIDISIPRNIRPVDFDTLAQFAVGQMRKELFPDE